MDTDTVLLRTYTEPGFVPLPGTLLSDETYAEVSQSIALATADIVLVDSTRERMYLARRRARPLQGWWWIGGRMMAGETPLHGAVRKLEQATSLRAESSRLVPVAVFNYLWKDRAQAPQDIGCHMVAHTYLFEPSANELQMIVRNLDPSEYDLSTGLVAFDRQRLLQEQVFPVISDLYDHLFPPVGEVEHGSLALISSDGRRDLFEITFETGTFNYFVIKQDACPLGQHFHRKKYEIFYFLEGGGTLTSAPVDGAGRVNGPVCTCTVSAGHVVRVPPRQTHRFDLRPGTRFVAFASAPFLPEDMSVCPVLPVTAM